MPEGVHVTIALLALLGSFSTNASATTDFMKEYGPEYAHRIALTRDADGEIQVIFSNNSGPERDDATEIVQATKFLDDDGKQSLLIMMQRPTEKLGALSEEDMTKIVGFFAKYFEGSKTDVFLSAKSDQELNTETWYAAIKDGTVKVKKVDEIKDFVASGDGVYLLVGANLGKIDAKKLDDNLQGDDGLILTGASQTVDVGSDVKLARGLKVEIEPGTVIETVAYVKDVDGNTKMILLDADELRELKEIDFAGHYATAGHDHAIVYVIEVDAVGTDKEDFTVVQRPSATFLDAVAA